MSLTYCSVYYEMNTYYPGYPCYPGYVDVRILIIMIIQYRLKFLRGNVLPSFAEKQIFVDKSGFQPHLASVII